MPRNESWPPTEPPDEEDPLSEPNGRGLRNPRVRAKALIFGPLLAVVGVVLLALRFPWQFVAIVAVVFALWLVFEG